MIKICSGCKLEKESSEYHKNPARKDGLTNYCKNCQSIKAAQRRREDPEKHREACRKSYQVNRPFVLARQREYRKSSKDKIKEKSQRYFQRNREKILEANRRYYRSNREKETFRRQLWEMKNPGKNAAKRARYRAGLLQATPSWTTEEMKRDIQFFYTICSEMIGTQKWEVDHIVPLRGKTVSGLHVPWNLQILPKSENSRKSNKFEPEVAQKT